METGNRRGLVWCGDEETRGERVEGREGALQTPGGDEDETGCKSEEKSWGTFPPERIRGLVRPNQRNFSRPLGPGPTVWEMPLGYLVDRTHRDALYLTVARTDDGNGMSYFMNFPSWNKWNFLLDELKMLTNSLYKDWTRRSTCWFKEKMVSNSMFLLFLYQEESGEEGVGREERPLPLAGRSADHRGGSAELRPTAILEWSRDSCELNLELWATYSLMLESFFRLFKDIKMVTHLKM